LDLDAACSHAQQIFRGGLVALVGSGISAAEGLPGMGALADHLLEVVSEQLDAPASEQWEVVAARLRARMGLEAALTDIALSEDVREIVTREVANKMLVAELPALERILVSSIEPPLSRLLHLLLRTTDTAHVVTTNYDRLIEYSAARGSVRLNTMFAGSPFGFLNELEASREHRQAKRRPGGRGKLDITTLPHVCLSKPHGSLDWYQGGVADSVVLQSQLQLQGRAPLIVAPGDGKLRLGYNRPFDAQRNRANKAIDQATGFLVLGYGFNDDHLQVHLKARYARVPSVIVTRDLTPGALDFLASNPNQAIAFTAPDDGSTGTLLTVDSVSSKVSDREIWKLDVFLGEVLAA
jgi:hypothetical protein